MSIAGEDARLFERAAAWGGDDFAALTPGRVAEIARSEGLDFATALLHDRILRVQANADFLRDARAQQPTKPAADLIGIAPGAFHREHHDTGADGARVLAIALELNCEAAVIPTASFGTLDENARVILDWLATQRGRRIALVSLSKGAADVKRALTLSAASGFTNVSAWVSFSGMAQGTPLIEWLHRRPLRWWGVRVWLWWHGYNSRALDELRHGTGTALSAWPTLPTHLRIVHVCGFPLRRHLTHAWAPRAYERLAALGPNDGGGILLADCATWPGVVCPVWGADHYLTPKWDSQPLLIGIVATALAAANDLTG